MRGGRAGAQAGGQASRWALLLAILLLPGCSKVLPPKNRVIALEGATLIDGAGGDPKQDVVIIIRNGHIEA
ncbi:MAG TPA: hypothetical protein VGU74_02375, partial [Gemmatimonadales bacterium]|nr:hypothetical protein [Gemmatimonadales bacterium]